MDVILIGFGFVVGCLAGILGIGGGLLMIPALTFVTPLFGLPAYPIHIASGMSAVQSLSSSTLSTYVYSLQKRIRWCWVMPLTGGSVFGALMGSTLSAIIPDTGMYALFMVFLSAALVMTMFRTRMRAWAIFQKTKVRETPSIRQTSFLIFSGFFVGFIAASVGVGGSVLVIPMLMTQFHQKTHHAIANSVAFVMLTGIVTVFGKALVGLVPIPEAIYITIGSVAGGWIGAKTNRYLPSVWLRTALVVLIAVTIVRTFFEIT